MSRAAQIKEHLLATGASRTAREICEALGFPAAESKFVSSILVTLAKAGTVVETPTICSVGNRKATSYRMAIYAPKQPAQAHTATPPPKGVPKTKKAKNTADRMHDASVQFRLDRRAAEQKAEAERLAALAADLEKRKEMRRKIAQEAQAEFSRFTLGQQKLEAVERARLTFARLTGSKAKNLEEMKLVYRRFALKFHPDHGGDGAIFADLNSAWQTLKQEAQNH